MKPRVLLSDIVVDKIKEIINNEKLKPGMQIPSEQQIASMLDVSIRTVREAVRTLASVNILEIKRGLGTFICSDPGVSKDPLGFDFMDADNLYSDLVEIRLILEPEIFVLASERATQKELEKVKDIIKQAKETVKNFYEQNKYENNEIIDKISEYDMQFHKALYVASHNKIANRILPLIIKTIWKLYENKTYRASQKKKKFSSMHEEIFNAILQKDLDLIRSLCKTHINKGPIESAKITS